ncbi:serine/threonine-protein kinase-like protein CCR4 [Argentina anserina]|uniref:serine/threonine-protein kinase-like protein CCR4 n=1 Tax=Argentina anserina TaxID=57926 RepID=UPI0021767DC6|nr:serine/threonine-protein kinase-like protein CCR4 [Potentilla anserina]
MASLIFSFVLFFFSCLIPNIHSLSTVSISETSNNQTLICSLTQRQSFLNCTSFPSGVRIPVSSNTSFTGLVGGYGFVCGLQTRSSSSSSVMTCWRFSANGTNMATKRIYTGPALKELKAGNSHVCGLVDGSDHLQCWQWHGFNSSTARSNISRSVAVGDNFVCGVSEIGGLTCTGSNTKVIDEMPRGSKFSYVSAGSNYACAISSSDSGLDCWGDMKGVKPQGRFISLALGDNRSCGLRPNGTVVCWGKDGFSLPQSFRDTYFISIEAKRSVFCGVLSKNLSLHCWGNQVFDTEDKFLVFSDVQPGPCRKKCPLYSSPLADYGTYCEEGYVVCQACQEPNVFESVPPSPQPQRESEWSKKMVAFLVVGCVGSVAFLLVCGYLVFKYCKIRGSRIHDSGPLDDIESQANRHGSGQGQQAQQPPVLEKRLSHLISLGANGGSLEEFSFDVLLEATNNFSEEHKIGTGSYGSVYYATLDDGNREVAIKRAESSAASSSVGGHTRRQEDKDNAFVNELESLSRLHHKNLVRLLGFYEDAKERILVYEYMNNGTLHDHLHKITVSPLTSWSARIQVALDAARGIEYLHVYAVPPIIHRDIKSSNILLDDKWRAKVSDFGLSLMGPEDDESYLSLRAAGTFGYMDPEYYRLQQLTTKSDVYSFGVVLLELLSGYSAIHKNENGVPRNVVDFVVPYIVNDEIHRVLDPKVPPPTPFEIEAVAYVGYLAADCVSLEGRDRPSMTEIASNLERALAFCLASPPSSRTESLT